jgi:mxaA protein
MTRATHRLVHLACIATLAMSMAAVGAARSGFVEQPRPFGHVIGDVVTQRVLLHADGREFEPAELPGQQRLGAWFERRAARVESSPDGRRWLVVNYQIINAPQTLTNVSLPAWELRSASGERSLFIEAWPLSVAPLTPRTALESGGLTELRPDRAAPVIATAPMRRQAWFWSIAFGVTLIAWLAWAVWRNWRASSHQPFARALREIRRVDENSPQAWQALHRAFDATAVRVVQAETLSLLFHRAPHLQPLRTMIERFFAQSAERFFGAGLAAEPISVRALCSDLRRIEKRRER